MSLSIIIPSKRVENLVPCIQAIRKHEPKLRIIVVNDGLDLRRIAHYSGCFLCAHDPIEVIEGVKPFVFARNMNRGIAAAGVDDVVLMNDDALLTTYGGFRLMHGQAAGAAIVAASTNVTGYLAQRRQAAEGIRSAEKVAFVCVLIPRHVINAIGLLDERFVTYGWEDVDYCRRVRGAGRQVLVSDGCFVDHSRLSSTFRPKCAGNAGPGNIEPGRQIFEAKWSTV